MKSRSTEWRIVEGSDLAPAIRHMWPAYNERFNAAHPSLDPRYIGLMHEYFADGDEVLLVHDRCLALLRPDGGGRWSTFLPSQGCVGALIVDPSLGPAEVPELFRGLAAALPGVTPLVSLRKQDSRIAQLRPESAGHAFEQSVVGPTTDVDVSGTFDDYWTGRVRSLRRRVPRLHRKLESEGMTVTLEKLTEPARMPGAIADHATLELGGWKGRNGTALTGSDAQSRFYAALLEGHSETREAVVHRLLLDGEVRASLLSVQGQGIMVVLKTAYDESYARYAPGRVLDYLMLQDVFATPELKLIENYTVASEEDRKWCTGERPIIDYDYFPSSLVRRCVSASRWVRRRFARQ